jgi:hypothetical protein
MKLSTGARPSPAMVVGVLALSLAIGGSAIAGTTAVTSKLDKKEKKQVKRIAKKQANKRITQRAPGLSVANAQSAVTAESAASADSLNGLRVLPIKHRSGDVTNATVFDAGGLQMRVSCALSDEELRASTTVAGGEIAAISDDAFEADFSAGQIVHNLDDDFNPGDDFDLQDSATASDDRMYEVQYLGGDGAIVTAHVITDDDVGSTNCVVSGYAVVIG